ncbi:Hypothetical protein AA314_03571 [Archangium gephyra]|uniref:Uncharacterized protein n=1 Tax=Archangium gephyra TaxID=48 RepID=A0AAC8Q6G2_9BACT|nr:Hypothetical protein AA314_03571 [Archangium gephyra]
MLGDHVSHPLRPARADRHGPHTSPCGRVWDGPLTWAREVRRGSTMWRKKGISARREPSG